MSYLFFEKSNVPLPVFDVGTKLRCLNTIEFVDGSIHKKDEIYIVEESTLSYFSVCHKNYDVIGHKKTTLSGGEPLCYI